MLRRTRRSRGRFLIIVSLAGVCALPLLTHGGALAASPSPSPAPSSTPAGPIEIDTCNVTKLNSGYGFGNLTVNGKGYNFFKIGFTNQGKAPADQIKFQVDFNSSRYIIADVGSYAPGVPVTHNYRDHGNAVVALARPGGNGPTVCSAVAVHFTDGTSWTAPPEPAPPSPTPQPPH